MKTSSGRLAAFATLMVALVLVLGINAPHISAATSVFINEIHYDNTGTDAGEAIEIAGPAGTDLTGWTIVLYNGSNGTSYGTLTLSGAIPDLGGGFGVVTVSGPATGIQNGAPDGIALVDAANSVVQFLSYEGTFSAVDGPANGQASTDIGVAEGSGTPVGYSLQLTGNGTTYEDFTWAAEAPNTFGAVNTGQTFAPSEPADPVINEFSASTVGTDVEYVEIYGDPNTDYSAYTVLEIEGDGSSSGTVDEVIAIGTTDANGLYLASLPASALENGTISLLLVKDFTGSLNGNLDTNNDGSFDVTPWEAIVDAVAVNDGGVGDFTYGVPVLGPNYDGVSSFAPGGASRIPDGFDTDAAPDWVRNDFDLAGIPGFTGTPDQGEAFNTPGAANAVVPPATPDLVINEIDYDQPGTDTAEYLEIKNVGATAASLDGVSVQLINGSGTVGYATFTLPAVSLAAGDYFVICANAANTANCDLDVSPDTNLIQNGVPDAAALVFDGQIVDAVSYEGDTGAPYTEGSGTGLEDAGVDGSISRCPDGTDTDQNNVDLIFTATITPGAENACGDSGPQAAKIHEVQGSGTAVAITTPVLVEAIVIGDFQSSDQLRGFFVQEEDDDADSDPATSEGVFVFCDNCGTEVAVGDLVEVTGLPSDFFGMSQIDASATGGAVSVLSSGNALPTAVNVDLPAPASTRAEATFEHVEGMLVTFTDTLVVSEYFELARYGQLVLTADARPQQFTDAFEPSVSGYAAFLDGLNAKRIILDDDNNFQNDALGINPIDDEPYFWPRPGLSNSNIIRGGDSISNLTGVMHWSFAGQNGTDAWRVRPVEEAFAYAFTSNNPRTFAPDPVGGNLKVSSFNVLNYFTTINSRGADSLAELDRQREKIAAAICELDADVLGLIEIENNDGVAADDLLNGTNGVNANCGPYAAVNTGIIGTDEIAVAFIYKPASVSTVGAHAILDSSVDPRFIDTKNRPALAQTFLDNETGGVFTVAVNHLKSKGSDCNDVGDPDLSDGAGNCNQTRKAAAEALVDWLATDPTGSGDPDVLIIGDLNSYRNEDPIDAIEFGADDAPATPDDYTDLLDALIGPSAYTYLFDGQLGYLDHALANTSLFDEITGVAPWHINADEIPVFDYNDDVRDGGNESSFERESTSLPIYEPNAYRASDHDPVLVGLDVCDEIAPQFDEVSLSPNVLWPPNHKYVTVEATVAVSDNFDPNPTITLVDVFSNEPDNGLGDGDTPNDIVIIDDFTFNLRAERSGNGTGRIYTIVYEVTDACGNSTQAEATVTVPLNKGK